MPHVTSGDNPLSLFPTIYQSEAIGFRLPPTGCVIRTRTANRSAKIYGSVSISRRHGRPLMFAINQSRRDQIAADPETRKKDGIYAKRRASRCRHCAGDSESRRPATHPSLDSVPSPIQSAVAGSYLCSCALYEVIF